MTLVYVSFKFNNLLSPSFNVGKENTIIGNNENYRVGVGGRGVIIIGTFIGGKLLLPFSKIYTRCLNYFVHHCSFHLTHALCLAKVSQT